MVKNFRLQLQNGTRIAFRRTKTRIVAKIKNANAKFENVARIDVSDFDVTDFVTNELQITDKEIIGSIDTILNFMIESDESDSD